MRLVLLLCGLLSLPLGATAQDYRIEQMKDNVYRVTAGHYRSVFMVTEEGLFLTDPISEEAATWLRAELTTRFDVPIRYLAYSHNHVDHTMGGNVLDGEGVTVIAHEDAASDLRRTRVPTALPEVTVRDETTVTLVDSRVELRHYGSNNGRGSVSMRFLPANVLFVVDWIVLGRMPYKDLPGYDIHGMIESTRAVLEGPDFDLFIGGHAEAGTHADVERYLAYLEDLYAAVRDGMLAGKTKEQLQDHIRLPKYSDLRMYEEWLPMNVAGVYDTLVDISYFNQRSDLDTEF